MKTAEHDVDTVPAIGVGNRVAAPRRGYVCFNGNNVGVIIGVE